MKITLYNINQKLYELDERYGEIYPKFKEIELKYIKKYDKALMDSQGFANQSLREAAARELMEKEEEYTEYHTLATEVRLIEVRMRNLQQISRNLISNNWYAESEVK